MLFSGVEADPTSGAEDGFQWGLGIGALFATFAFSTASVFSLFRVIFSSRATRRRKRMAKLWLLGFVGVSIYIAFN
jgi:asparagine N-glycosylation enzyme membrane subunit Stt3